MNAPVKPGTTIVGPGGQSLVDDINVPAPEHFGRFWKPGDPAPTWSPVAEEAPPTGLAYMRQNGGTFRLWTERSKARPAAATRNDACLSSEVEAALGSHWRDVPADRRRTLFDISTKNTTRSASKYAAGSAAGSRNERR